MFIDKFHARAEHAEPVGLLHDAFAILRILRHAGILWCESRPMEQTRIFRPSATRRMLGTDAWE